MSGYVKRNSAESRNEVVIRGPKEAFLEDLKINITMIRRKIKSSMLKLSWSFVRLTSAIYLPMAFMICSMPSILARANGPTIEGSSR
ncbi:spore germination protein [Paenibacillus eucommiae]|uniref:spore germination protein n=1 Tax=Paenibacillus eucommiae TaxID=1355755 RepID=UPI001AE7760E|nr:spore germination protein [Paenibacillus eucommiae]